MDSSEKMFAGGRSNFSQTCSLLSHYLKERRTFGDLNLGLTPNSGIETKGTLDLLPKIEESGRTAAETGQMTIFYGGRVMVFDRLPAEKAKEIMTLARNSSTAAFAPPPSPSESSTNTPAHFRLAVLDLPIKRKHSLARFFEKRKDRIVANAPYQLNKRAKNAAWLGLAPEIPFQIQRL